MLLFTAISLLFIFWIILLLLDFYLRQSNFGQYIKFLENYGISFTSFQLRIYLANIDRHSPKFASFLHNIDKFAFTPKKSKILAIWFTLGAFISLLCFIATPVYLFRLFLSELTGATFHGDVSSGHTQKMSQQTALPTPLTSQHSLFYIPLHDHINAGITPVFPGINLPLSHMPIFMTVLILASIVHEAGHAIAAANANVRVTGLGLFFFAIYPGAFTEVEPNELDRCSYAQKLRIFGAGIWHNFILAIIGVMILIAIPILSFPLYSNNSGIIVTEVDSKSGLSGPTGLQPGYHITKINQCEVKNKDDWGQCFIKVQTNHSSGYLAHLRAVSQMTANSEYVLVREDGEVHCCGEFNVTSSTHICFRYSQIKRANKTSAPSTTPKPIFPKFPDFEAEFGLHPRRKRANLKIRFPSTLATPDTDLNEKEAVQIGTKYSLPSPTPSNAFFYACLPAMQIAEHAQCEVPANALHNSPSTLPPGYVCVMPALFNDTVLLRFQVKGHQKPVLFIGCLTEPIYAVDATELTPRFYLIPWWLPRIVELFARYTISLSLAMAILNAVPCYGLDGQFISSTVVDYFLQNNSASLRKRVDKSLMVCGTALFCSNILIGFIKSFTF